MLSNEGNLGDLIFRALIALFRERFNIIKIRILRLSPRLERDLRLFSLKLSGTSP